MPHNEQQIFVSSSSTVVPPEYKKYKFPFPVNITKRQLEEFANGEISLYSAKKNKQNMLWFLQTLSGTGVVTYPPLSMVTDVHDKRKINGIISHHTVPHAFLVWGNESTWNSEMLRIHDTVLEDSIF
jgi:hypothetical protein